MNIYETKLTGKTIVIGLKPGDEIQSAIDEAIRLHDIRFGVIVSGVAALKKAVFHRMTKADNWDTELDGAMEIVTIEAPMEMSGFQGLISEGKSHVHFTISDHEGNTYSGHMEPGCEVLYVSEIVLLEIEDAGFARRKDGKLTILRDAE